MPKLASSDGEFHGPSIDEFFPEILFNVAGIPVHRIHLVQLLAVVVVVLLLVLGTRRMKIVPGRFQSVVEMGLDFVRT
ncbi:F0F1 ATP synthase subunit A, partial [Mycobacterium tuberculosis]|nr:F0F1 ATP synthase subunit A [Mycobacterium tuberculosis]